MTDVRTTPEPKNRAHLIGTMYAEEDALPREIAELDAVLGILNTTAWTPDAFQLDGTLPGDDALHSKFDVCFVELRRLVLMSRRRDNGGLFRGYSEYEDVFLHALDDSPFWVCVEEAKREALLCLRQHQMKARDSLDPPTIEDIVTGNTGQYRNLKTPGAPNQVHVAYSLVSLLYATFSIPVPTDQQTPVWGALPVYAFQNNVESKPAFECLDLTSNLVSGTSKDKYGLKPKLHAGRFEIEDVGWEDLDRISDPPHPNHRIQWVRRQRMPWLHILSEIVGYVRFAESLVPDADKPAKSVLQEMRDYCTAEMARRRSDLDSSELARTVATLDMARDFFAPKPKPDDPDARHARLCQLLSCMQSINM